MTELPRSLQKGAALREAWQQRRPTAGVWSTLGSAEIAGLLAQAGLDYLLIDLEHGMGGIDGLIRQTVAVDATPCAIVARLPDHSAGGIKRVLDAGANALLVPQVESADEAEHILDAALFPPEGRRGVAVGAITASDRGYAPEAYFHHANAALSVIAQIESPKAAAQLDAFLKIDRLDGIFIGPNDLSATMGLFRQWQHPEFLSLFDDVQRQTLAAGKLFGALPFPGRDAAALRANGAVIVPNGSDQGFLRAGALAQVAALQGDA
ncbi:MAG: aldolase/citrate lyase family protein [Pseudomonadota bacterium]